jgi:AraC-like DNA-binding protein
LIFVGPIVAAISARGDAHAEPVPPAIVTAGRGITLRWTVERGISCRAYELGGLREPHFCVSTQSSELTFVLEGEVGIEFGPADKQQRIGPGGVFLVLQGTPHRIHTSSHARLMVLDVAYAGRGSLGVGFMPAGPAPGSFDRGLRRLWESGHLKPTAPFTEPVQELLTRLRPDQILTFEASHNTQRLLEIKRYLEGCYTAPINLATVAQCFRMDRFYLVRAFKSNFGLTPYAYVRFLRHKHFLWAMFVGGKRHQTQLAAEAGFGDYSTFCRDFRQRTGRPPSKVFAAARVIER